ncbi:hypothetical protein EON82_13540 [bacterium]|nr:MAG: hypothetical protein EON82_13540 [bacterium]
MFDLSVVEENGDTVSFPFQHKAQEVILAGPEHCEMLVFVLDALVARQCFAEFVRMDSDRGALYVEAVEVEADGLFFSSDVDEALGDRETEHNEDDKGSAFGISFGFVALMSTVALLRRRPGRS